MLDILELLGLLNEKPSRRPWINRIVWSFAIAAILVTVACYGLTALHHLTGWPPA